MRLSRATIFMVAAAACWGLGAIATKSALNAIPPLTLLVIQLIVSSSFLWLVFLVKRPPLKLGKEIVHLGLAGLLNPGLAYTFALLGLSMTTASASSLLWAAEPALILFLAWLVLRERPTSLTLMFSAIALTGAVFVIGGVAGIEFGGIFSGNILIVLAVLCCAIYTVLSRKSVEKVNPISLVAIQLTVSLIWALLIWPLEITGGTMDNLRGLGPDVWMMAVISGLVYYALAFLFYISGLRQMPASEAGLYLNLIPLFGLGGAYILLGDRLMPIQWMGAALILVAVFGISILQRKGAVLRPARSEQEPRIDVVPE